MSFEAPLLEARAESGCVDFVSVGGAEEDGEIVVAINQRRGFEDLVNSLRNGEGWPARHGRWSGLAASPISI